MRRFGLAVVAMLLALTGTATAPSATGRPPAAGASTVSGFLFYKFPIEQPGCSGVGFNAAPDQAYERTECGFSVFTISPAPTGANPVGVAKLYKPGTREVFETLEVTWDEVEAEARLRITPSASWPAGEITFDVFIGSETASAGGAKFLHNHLGAELTVTPKAGGYAPGDPIPVIGSIFEQRGVLNPGSERVGVPASYSLRVTSADGVTTHGPFTANADGAIARTLPASATANVVAGPDTRFRASVVIEVVNTKYIDSATGEWSSLAPARAVLPLVAEPTTLLLENSFVSAFGWVKPGDHYPFRVFVQNYTSSAKSGARVTVPPVDGNRFLKAHPVTGSGTATLRADGSIQWDAGTVPAATAAGPGLKTLVVEARADTLGEDARIVWKDLSTTAALTYAGGPSGLRATSEGPKVIPPGENYETARYGARPFPVVPVDYVDRKHEPIHSGDRLSDVINSPLVEGSTFNLYQEMSYGQLFPHGTVPSAGIATADFDYAPGFDFTELAPSGTCRGVTLKDGQGTPLYDKRIVDGYYQLPGTTDYYGDDRYVSGLPGAITGVGLIFDIDSACGPTAKSVYDAAQIADPEIDYSDFDTDKDGVVDFFMMVFVGLGGHGDSQVNGTPSYDNIWPHSSSLEFTYTDEATGLKGYISDDQLKDLSGRPLFYTDGTYSAMTTSRTSRPVLVRVGPYNVNPESSVEKASVISHEYGHSLGLPDFYSLGGRETYGDWNLMATDKSHNMDIFSKQELGWLVPRVLPKGRTTVRDWRDSKVNTHRIDWQTKDGTPYTLSGPRVNNGEGYAVKLPARRVLDPQKVRDGASPTHLWWSTSGNDFGCVPDGGKNFDIYLPELADVPVGTEVTVSFNSLWSIEWDYDYGFVMYSTDEGKNYTSMPSAAGYTTPAAQNPTASACQAEYGNGITGSSGSYAAGTQDVDRTGVGDATGAQPSYPDPIFVADSYDMTAAAGSPAVLRFSYYTDPGLARPGWFIDDVKVTAGGKVIYRSDFEDGGQETGRIFNGGCNETTRVATVCTKGWQYVDATAGHPADHGYYLEMRDRSGFDFDGKGQNGRDPISFAPGVLLVYTNEAHGYGNVGTDNPPAQTPLDSQPEPLNDTPDLNDAAFTAAAGDRRYTDSGTGHTDNYDDPSASVDGNPNQEWRFRFRCLTFDVLRMTGDRNNAAAVRDLEGDVRFDVGSGCAPFDYGYAGAVVTPPVELSGDPMPKKRPVAGRPGSGLAATGLSAGLPLVALLLLTTAAAIAVRRQP